jgi:fucose permease
LDENKMIFLSILVILAGMIVLLAAPNILILSIGACIAGFGTSAVFPTNVSRFSRTFGEGAMRRAMPLFICGTLGATAVTWLIGYVSDSTGSLRSGMTVLLASVVILLVIQIFLSLRKPLTKI